MVPHLVRAQSAYKNIRIHTHTHAHAHTHTHNKHMLYWWLIGKMTDQYAEEKRWVFSFELKKRVKMNAWQREGVPEHRSNVLKGSLPQGPPAHPRNTEYLSICGWAKRMRRRVEMKKLREVWRGCTRNNVEADESYFVLNPAADW